VHLPAYEGEPCTQLAKRFDDPEREPLLKFAFAGVRVDCEKIESVRIFGELLREVGMNRTGFGGGSDLT
jgi:hypothetical protein